MKRYYIFFAVLAAICAVAISSNLLIRRGPVHDAKAAADIRSLQSAIDNHYVSRNSQLPATLAEVRVTGDVTKRMADYTYRKTGTATYELCTTFITKQQNTYPPDSLKGPGDIPTPENHDKGHQCFTYTVLPGYPMKDLAPTSGR